MASNEHSVKDPCAHWGTDQWLALVWFIGVMTIGVGFVYTLAHTDYYNFTHNGEYFNVNETKLNRMAQAGLRSDTVDPRTHATYDDAVKNVTK